MPRSQIVPVRKEGNTIVSMKLYQPPGVLDNPWFGNQRSVVVGIAEELGLARFVTGSVTSDDYQALVADGVVEAYAAVYSEDSGEILKVRGIKLKHPHPSPPSNLGILRLRADVLVFVQGRATPCFAALEGYMKSLVK